jgi:adenylate cyclase
MSDDPGNDYFSEGMSEEILHLLATISDLKVIGRTSSFSFKGKNLDLRSIGTALGVKTIPEGSVRKSGERIRITTQLVNASDGAEIWSETYDRTITDIFAVQDDVAAAIIDALHIHINRAPARGHPTSSPEAYALFLKARAAVNVFEWQDAEELLLTAVALDPKFAEAYELLAFTYSYVGGDIESQRRIGEAAAKAIDLDPGLVRPLSLTS